MRDELSIQLEARKVQVLYDQAFGVLTTALIVGIILATLFWSELPDGTALIWVSVLIILTVLRLFGVYQYKRGNVSAEKYLYWLHWYNLGTFISGLLWAAITILLIKYADITNVSIAVIIVGFVVAMTAVSYTTSLLTYTIFSSFALIIPSIYMIMQINPVLNIGGYLIIIFYIFLISSSWRLNRMTTKSLSYEFDNKNLLVELEEEKDKAEQLADKLQTLAEKLQTLSSRDGLTGIYNRRRFDEVLVKEWNRSARSGTSLSLIMCDIDYFKPYNDLYGHQEGDKCLSRIARLLEDFARRSGDVAARYGGEEFAIILPNTTIETAESIAEQIRTALVDLKMPHSASRIKDIVTASFGVASIIPSKDKTADILIKQADMALYKAKSAGRNCVIANVTKTKF